MSQKELLEKKPLRKGTPLGKSEEGYVISLDEEHAYTLNPAAFYVWLLCDGKLTVNDIIDKIAESTGLVRGELEEPISYIVSELLKVNLLE